MKQVLLILTLASTHAMAQLSWDNRQLDFHPTLNDTNVVARFTYKNMGTTVVNIKDVKVSCGCMAPTFDKKALGPGENGVMTANFNIGQRTGFQQSHFYVQTDDPQGPVTQLTMRMYLPELVKITPSFVYWQVGETNAPKTMNVEVVYASPINLLSVDTTNDRVFPKLVTIKPGKSYQIVVTPESTVQAASARIKIRSDFPKDRPRSFSARADIKALGGKEFTAQERTPRRSRATAPKKDGGT